MDFNKVVKQLGPMNSKINDLEILISSAKSGDPIAVMIIYFFGQILFGIDLWRYQDLFRRLPIEEKPDFERTLHAFTTIADQEISAFKYLIKCIIKAAENDGLQENKEA